MGKCYIELRRSAARGTDSTAADIMRHLHARQHLGKALVIAADPIATMAAARKQWLKLSRTLQKQRAQTLNADKILKYTHTIARMQHLQFSIKAPLDEPNADIYFQEPKRLNVTPVHCWTIYVLTEPSEQTATSIIMQLPAEALFVDYQQTLSWQDLGLQPKKVLEAQVDAEWRQVQQFLQANKIDISQMETGDMCNVDAMDDALDTLLGTSRKFLQVANEFQRALELARPLRINKTLRTYYDSLMLLAHRVQALSPGVFTQHFLETYNEDDTFFLHDSQRGKYQYLEDGGLHELYERHMAAGRVRLANALAQAGQERVVAAYQTRPAYSDAGYSLINR